METTIQDELYSYVYDGAAGVLYLKGILRLNGTEEYAPLVALLTRALDEHENGSLVLDLCGLEFLNSSGIATLSRFVIDCRNRKTVALTVRGTRNVAWQGKSLPNLQRLMPALGMEIV